ncbi:hypothetical protein XMV225_001876 [Aliiroseovarius sp. xm-v-225]|uniref:DUF7146 domain-containing protein n=1 Tax=unclassified Aliiroseovarius TaxID=2623558 RepID=UPI0015698A52|nr:MULTISPECIES: toprim domain-containing protein [unclassified Aliiroseovarius]NRP44709.1 hypothetical protein [Aliiroseovarius sp. xm-m-378]NRP65580.1 hypothetical protein [Aliiroseovarius sp. xm-v-225]NRP92641.1 hypothetical protein [Aliiroseovarius sp. xm-a-134]
MSDAKALTAALKGRWHGGYGLAYCPAHHNTKTPALSLSDGAEGQLLAHCHAGCDFLDILDALKGMGLIEGRSTYTPPDPAELAQRRRREKAKLIQRGNQARAIWENAVPIGGTLAETYLRKRGITCTLPATLRFNPECWHHNAQRVPAMIGLIEGAKGFAVHRTYLDASGTKADISPNKAMLGTCKGGAVRLSEGIGPLVITEGTETALSLASGLLDGPATIWAALSTSGMQSLSLPALPHKLIIASDSDDSGAGFRAAQALAQRASALGWEVSLLPAPQGQDWNDYLNMKGGTA